MRIPSSTIESLEAKKNELLFPRVVRGKLYAFHKTEHDTYTLKVMNAERQFSDLPFQFNHSSSVYINDWFPSIELNKVFITMDGDRGTGLLYELRSGSQSLVSREMTGSRAY